MALFLYITKDESGWQINVTSDIEPNLSYAEAKDKIIQTKGVEPVLVYQSPIAEEMKRYLIGANASLEKLSRILEMMIEFNEKYDDDPYLKSKHNLGLLKSCYVVKTRESMGLYSK